MNLIRRQMVLGGPAGVLNPWPVLAGSRSQTPEEGDGAVTGQTFQLYPVGTVKKRNSETRLRIHPEYIAAADRAKGDVRVPDWS